jgi:hypothetical protein
MHTRAHPRARTKHHTHLSMDNGGYSEGSNPIGERTTAYPAHTGRTWLMADHVQHSPIRECQQLSVNTRAVTKLAGGLREPTVITRV